MKIILWGACLFILLIVCAISWLCLPASLFSLLDYKIDSTDSVCMQATGSSVVKQLSHEDLAALNGIMGHCSITREYIDEKPELLILVRNKAGIEEEYAVFLKKRLLFKGDYLDAWSEGMNGQKTFFYKLGEDDCKMIRQVAGQ